MTTPPNHALLRTAAASPRCGNRRVSWSPVT